MLLEGPGTTGLGAKAPGSWILALNPGSAGEGLRRGTPSCAPWPMSHPARDLTSPAFPPSPSWASYQPSVTPAETFHSSVRAQPGAVSKPSALPGRRQHWVRPRDEREGPGAHLAGSTPTQLPFALSPVTHLSLLGQLVPEWVCEVSYARHSGPYL